MWGKKGEGGISFNIQNGCRCEQIITFLLYELNILSFHVYSGRGHMKVWLVNSLLSGR